MCSSPRPRSTVSFSVAVVLDDQRRVLGRHLVQHFGDALLVAAALRLDRHAAHRRRELQRPHVDLVLVVRVVQHAVEVDLVDLRDRGDVARHRGRHVDRLRALQHQQVPDLEGLAAAADEQLRVLGDRALVHAEDAELADVRIDHDLEHVRQHVLLRIGLGAEFLDRLAVDHLALVEERRVALGGIRQQLLEDVQQFGKAGAVARRHEAHRHQVALAQRLLERRVQLRRGRVPRPARGTSPSVPRRPRPPGRSAPGGRRRRRRNRSRRPGLKKQSTTFVPFAAGQVDRQHFLAEHRAQVVEQLRQVDVVGVDLVDDQQAAQLALRRPSPSCAT